MPASRLLENIKEMEHQGYDFEVAEGNFELLVLQERFPDKRFFSLVGFDVATKAYGRESPKPSPASSSTIRAICAPPPAPGRVRSMRFTTLCANASPAIIPASTRSSCATTKFACSTAIKGTAAKVRVLVEWADDERSWTTVGISHDVIQASARAMLDAIRLELLRAHASGQDRRSAGAGTQRSASRQRDPRSLRLGCVKYFFSKRGPRSTAWFWSKAARARSSRRSSRICTRTARRSTWSRASAALRHVRAESRRGLPGGRLSGQRRPRAPLSQSLRTRGYAADRNHLRRPADHDQMEVGARGPGSRQAFRHQ